MTDTKPDKRPHGLLNFLLDFGPLLLFFAAYRFAGPTENPVTAAITATLVFMVAITIALIVSKWKIGRISPMMGLSAVLILGFGALTIYFRDPQFIQIKPTLIYAFFAIMLAGGLLRGKPLLKLLLEYAYDGLSDEGWRKLSRNWAIFFAFLAIANEILRNPAWFDFNTWLTLKVWGVTALTLVFAIANVPMLMRHGLKIDQEHKSDTLEVPPQ